MKGMRKFSIVELKLRGIRSTPSFSFPTFQPIKLLALHTDFPAYSLSIPENSSTRIVNAMAGLRQSQTLTRKPARRVLPVVV